MPTIFRQSQKRFRVQWKPNFIGDERRLVLTRICWNRGKIGDGKGCSTKVSVSVSFLWQYFFVGLFVRREYAAWKFYICLLPCLPVRIHWKRSYGGSFV